MDRFCSLIDTDLLTASYDYALPPELIAQKPIEPRDASRLLVVPRRGGDHQHQHFSDLPDWLEPGDVLVINDTRVIPARLWGIKPSGAKIEILLLRPWNGDNQWLALARPGKKLPVGSQIVLGDGRLQAVVTDVLPTGERVLALLHEGPLFELLEKIGEPPLPPYITDRTTPAQRYQTVYADHPGSVAAPTAGLHFTPDLLAKLSRKGIETVNVTLHVGIGTFRPVSSDVVDDHPMHSEWYQLGEDAAARLNRREGRIVAVGTTAVRVLETVMGRHDRFVADAGETDIFIRPGYRFRAIDGLITNFHLPRSTLLMLVSAFAGREQALAVYQEAVARRYRFFSFGDACLFV